jgi:hypothetical protein
VWSTHRCDATFRSEGIEIDRSPAATVSSLQVRRRDVLGGLLHEDEAAA